MYHSTLRNHFTRKRKRPMVDGMVGELWSIPLRSKRIQEGRSHCLLNGTTTKTLLTCVPVTSGCASSQESIRHLAKHQDYYMFQLVHYVHTGLNGKRNGPRRTFNLRCFLLMVIGGVRGNRLRKKNDGENTMTFLRGEKINPKI